ncbi:hypothetical protein CWT12_11040 [Actinomyces sp. 432]|uniref:hypothetical protein n=1 Tax=Actinomyces sp. 432 TaxID=2057798 RepID=UPI001373F301|nr:hypothetical protein [Actinomyces sp. 432]QHO91735.1 hypothetical protein CWT12_11040 [Actinomyces sp. 432]
MAANQSTQVPPRSKYFGLMFFLACVLGIAAAFGMYAWISSQATHPTRIRVMVLMIPFTIMLYAVTYIDKQILAKYPHLVGAKYRERLAAELGHDPITGAPYPPLYESGSANPQPDAQGYGQVPAYGATPQAPGQGTGQAPAANAYGSYGSYGNTSGNHPATH